MMASALNVLVVLVLIVWSQPQHVNGEQARGNIIKEHGGSPGDEPTHNARIIGNLEKLEVANIAKARGTDGDGLGNQKGMDELLISLPRPAPQPMDGLKNGREPTKVHPTLTIGEKSMSRSSYGDLEDEIVAPLEDQSSPADTSIRRCRGAYYHVDPTLPWGEPLMATSLRNYRQTDTAAGLPATNTAVAVDSASATTATNLQDTVISSISSAGVSQIQSPFALNIPLVPTTSTTSGLNALSAIQPIGTSSFSPITNLIPNLPTTQPFSGLTLLRPSSYLPSTNALPFPSQLSSLPGGTSTNLGQLLQTVSPSSAFPKYFSNFLQPTRSIYSILPSQQGASSNIQLKPITTTYPDIEILSPDSSLQSPYPQSFLNQQSPFASNLQELSVLNPNAKTSIFPPNYPNYPPFVAGIFIPFAPFLF